MTKQIGLTKTLTRREAVGILASKIFLAPNDQLEAMLLACIDDFSGFVIIDDLAVNYRTTATSSNQGEIL